MGRRGRAAQLCTAGKVLAVEFDRQVAQVPMSWCIKSRCTPFSRCAARPWGSAASSPLEVTLKSSSSDNKFDHTQVAGWLI